MTDIIKTSARDLVSHQQQINHRKSNSYSKSNAKQFDYQQPKFRPPKSITQMFAEAGQLSAAQSPQLRQSTNMNNLNKSEMSQTS